MPEPITMATVAEAAALAGKGAATSAGGVSTAEVGSALAAAGELPGSAAGGTTEAFVGALHLNPPAVGEAVLGRADASGATLSEALGKSGADLGSMTKNGVEVSQGPGAFDASQWTNWRPESGERVMPQSIAERFRPLREPSNLEAYTRHLERRDSSFAQELTRREQQLRNARSPAELDAAIQQLRKSTAGKLGEAIATDGLKPYFDGLEVQRRVETSNGTTIIDGRFTGARNPIAFGRGHGVPEGGSLSVEVKTGQPMYLEREVRHITERQVQGHLASGDQSLVVVSRDVYAMTGERTARDTVADAGSRVMALLPEKRALDECLLRILRERLERAGT